MIYRTFRNKPAPAPAASTLCLVLSVAIPGPLTASADVPPASGAEGHGLLGEPWQAGGEIPTLGAEFGVDMVPAPQMLLPDRDNEFFLAEDEVAGVGPKPLRFAVPFETGLSVNDGMWLDVPGGRLWRVEVLSSNAHTARLRLGGLALADGQQMRLSSPGWAQSVVGPIVGRGEFDDGTAWAMSTPTPRILIEWFVPDGQRVAGLPFTEAEYFHGYRDIWAGIREADGEAEGGVAAAGPCHLDPVCFPTWTNESNGTVRLIFTGSLCSGQLTATTAADETPYVSTANHCIATQSTANSCQFNFFYRRNTCAASAAASAGISVQGGDLVATFAASDCTLLMIRPTLPTQAFWVGWTSASTPTGTTAVGLHHPDGDYQRISFGNKNASAFNCGSPTSNWSSLSWSPATQYGVTTTGVTEGGSSGSAIYRTSDKRMFGVLTCGGSSCSATAADDGYGRWDTAVLTSGSGFGSALASGSDDSLEANDSCDAARAVAPGSYPSLVVKRLDEDWYALTVPIGGQLVMNMTFTHANGNINLSLQSSCTGSVLLARSATTSNESFSWVNTGGSTTVLMRVFLASDTRNEYSFTYSTVAAPPTNDNCAGAVPAGTGTFPFNTDNATNSSPAIPASCNTAGTTTMNKDVWWLFTSPSTGTATASACNAPFDTNLAIYPGDSCPTATTVVACDDNGCGAASVASWPVTSGSRWFVRLGAPSGGSGSGALSLTVQGPPCPADFDLDGQVNGDDLGALLVDWGDCGGGTCPADLNGDFVVNGDDLGLLLVDWGNCP